MSIVLETARLYCRSWKDSDLFLILDLHQNQEVMKYFPGIASVESCKQFLKKMQGVFNLHAYAYLPVIKKDSNEFIGWVGISNQKYLEPPFVDIGWRILPQFWGKGFATEMASAFLRYGFNECGLNEIFAVAPKSNLPSITVMKRIGMDFESEFLHPLLSVENYPNHGHLQKCVRFRQTKPS